MSKSFIFIFLAIVAVVGTLFYVYNPSPTEYQNPSPQPTNEEQVFCTMEAKLCPDGSYVGRNGPKCEFDPCPTSATSTATTSKQSSPLPE